MNRLPFFPLLFARWPMWSMKMNVKILQRKRRHSHFHTTKKSRRNEADIVAMSAGLRRAITRSMTFKKLDLKVALSFTKRWEGTTAPPTTTTPHLMMLVYSRLSRGVWDLWAAVIRTSTKALKCHRWADELRPGKGKKKRSNNEERWLQSSAWTVVWTVAHSKVVFAPLTWRARTLMPRANVGLCHFL